MNQGVDEPEKCAVATREKPYTQPDIDGHYSVVIDVKKRHLISMLKFFH
jgi:hypothetical protein